MNNNIMCFLPNDLILKIIREADGGLNAHKKKMKHIHGIILQSNNHKVNHIRLWKKSIERRYIKWEM